MPRFLPSYPSDLLFHPVAWPAPHFATRTLLLFAHPLARFSGIGRALTPSLAHACPASHLDAALFVAQLVPKRTAEPGAGFLLLLGSRLRPAFSHCAQQVSSQVH